MIAYKRKLYDGSKWLTSYKKKLYMGRNITWNQICTLPSGTFHLVNQNDIITQTTEIKYGHRYYVSFYAKYAEGNTNTSEVEFKMGDFTNNEFVMPVLLTDNWTRYEKIDILNSAIGDTPAYQAGFQKTSLADQTLVMSYKDGQIFDLTLMFGPGNEPKTPSEFWSHFPNKLYPYNTGEMQPLFTIARKSAYIVYKSLYVSENLVIPQTIRA